MMSQMSHRIDPIEMFRSLLRNWHLIIQMTKREVIGRYRGSFIGIAWSFFNPLLMLIIYTFVFSVVFKARWSLNGNENKADFAIILFTGLIFHGLFAECVNRAPELILSNVNYVKKVVFPLEVLPWIAFGSALFHAIISLIVLILAQLFINHQMPWTIVFIPLILFPLMFATIGFAWFLSALGVYVRDIGQFTGIFTTALLFLSGVFFPISVLPLKYQAWLKLNPLVYIIEEGRNILIYGKVPNFGQWSIILVTGLLFAWTGFTWFQKSRNGFADVL
jgi:lipopolysaccharide transport system permease protein